MSIYTSREPGTSQSPVSEARCSGGASDLLEYRIDGAPRRRRARGRDRYTSGIAGRITIQNTSMQPSAPKPITLSCACLRSMPPSSSARYRPGGLGSVDLDAELPRMSPSANGSYLARLGDFNEPE